MFKYEDEGLYILRVLEGCCDNPYYYTTIGAYYDTYNAAPIWIDVCNNTKIYNDNIDKVYPIPKANNDI